MKEKLKGKIISDKMEKTVVVGVATIKQHPLYRKRVRRVRKCYAHDELGVKEGDRVLIESTRPLSKLKRWKVVKIMDRH